MIEFKEKNFNAFVKKHESNATSYLYSRFPVISRDDIRDIVQESYIVLYNNLKTQKVSELIYPYFLKICINQSLKKLNELNKVMIVGINDTDIMQKNAISMKKVEAVLQTNEEDESVKEEKKTLVHKTLDQMPKRCKELLWSYYAYELSWATIAQQYGLKDATSAKSAASRCRQTFKTKYNNK